MGRWPAQAALALAGVWAGAPAAACRIALILALDVSGSVDTDEYRQQLDGIAWALEDAEVQSAILAFPDAPVVLSAFEWSAMDFQRDVVDWTVLDSPAALSRIATTLRERQRSYGPTSTALGSALLHAGRRLAAGPECWRRVIDVSGDGRSNQSLDPRSARRSALLGGVTINALAVGARRESIDRRSADIAELSAYYAAEVVQGPGAFVETALGYSNYARAIRRKLLRELAPLPVGTGPAGRSRTIAVR